jgi:molybdate transport system substrate-binding protein
MSPAGAPRVTGISSMATRELLAELAALYRRKAGTAVAIESVGGVEAARRIRAGEAFDVAVLADEAMAALESEGRVVAGTRVGVAASGVAVAVRDDAALPDIGTAQAVRKAALEAASVGYSTGPSGVHVARLFEHWGISEAIGARLVQAPPGIAIGGLVASGAVELGFQQLSELVHMAGIRVVGPLPPEIQLTTIFSGGACAASSERHSARAWLAFIASPECDDARRRHGMEPAPRSKT